MSEVGSLICPFIFLFRKIKLSLSLLPKSYSVSKFLGQQMLPVTMLLSSKNREANSVTNTCTLTTLRLGYGDNHAN